MSGEAGGSGGSQAVSPELVGAMVPAQILQEDEVVLVLTKPSLWYIFYTSFSFLAGTLLLGIIAAQLYTVPWTGDFPPPRTVAWLTVAVCVGRLIWALLVWTSHTYMLTNRRIVTIKGVVNVHMFQASLRKIQKTDVYRPLGQRIFAAGTIGFATAAGGVESTWEMIGRPLETHEQIIAAINKLM